MADKKPQFVKLMVDGELEKGLVYKDGNGEWVVSCRPSGRQFFFPGNANLAAEVKKHNTANGAKPVLAEEVEEENALLAAWDAGEFDDEDAGDADGE